MNNARFETGDRVRLEGSTVEPNLRGEEGEVVSIQEPPRPIVVRLDRSDLFKTSVLSFKGGELLILNKPSLTDEQD